MSRYQIGQQFILTQNVDCHPVGHINAGTILKIEDLHNGFIYELVTPNGGRVMLLDLTLHRAFGDGTLVEGPVDPASLEEARQNLLQLHRRCTAL